jgi:hypothetical protein
MTLYMPIPPEPMGKLITMTQDILTMHGVLAEFDFSDAPVRGGEKHKGDEPPMIVVDQNSISDFPFGEGTGRLGVADYTFTMRCYGRKAISGEREALRLAGLVRAGLHNHPPVVMGTVGIYRIRVLSSGQPLRDPDEDTPFVPVSIGLYAATVAAAS